MFNENGRLLGAGDNTEMSETSNGNGAQTEAASTAHEPPAGPMLEIAEDFNAESLSGTKSLIFADRLTQQVIHAQSYPAGDAEECSLRATAAMAALKNLAPQDAGEGMLAAQMVAVHNIGMDCLIRAMGAKGDDKAMETHMRQGGRFLQLYLKQLDQLGRKRGRRRQSVRIEHERAGEDGRVKVRAEDERVR